MSRHDKEMKIMTGEVKDIKNVAHEADEVIETWDSVNHIKIKPMVNINITIRGIETPLANSMTHCPSLN